MNFLGLHLVDWIVLVIYIIIIVAIGIWTRRRIRNTRDFYQGGRSFGKTITAFLNFGNMTDAGQTAGITSEIYRQGLSGIWFQNVVLFHTPFQWFTASLQRRARYIGPADIYLHRFESRFLAGLYATVILILALYANAQGYLLTGKTLHAMMVKPEIEYTVTERARVDGYREMKELQKIAPSSIDPTQQSRLVLLEGMQTRGEITPYISYLDLTTFYIVYAVMIAGYTALGGLFAIAIIDIIQGILIVFLSVALIPAALAKIGGIAGMQQSVPGGMFELFGTSATSDYTWYFVASFALLNLVANAPKSFTLGGSARDDKAARLGFVSGAITKRFMIVAWAFTGLLAVGLYSGAVADSASIWGYMTRDLLGVGAIGLMIVAIFSANMDGSATASLDASAAVIKNIIQPLRPATSERQQIFIGRIVIFGVLGTSILVADNSSDLLPVFRQAVSIAAITGASFWLAYFWRRLTTKAIVVQMLVSITLTVAIANIVPAVDSLATDPYLTRRTTERIEYTNALATQSDVAAGRADTTGQPIVREERIKPTSIFFESIAEPKVGPARGIGPFRTQVWILSSLGVDFAEWKRAEIMTITLLFDVIVPFILLISISLCTRRNSEHVLRDFYARIHTPAVADPALDAQLVQQKIDNPELVEQDKIFPGTDLEFWKPTPLDIIGFLACLGFVVVIIMLFMWVSSIGS